MAYRSIRHQVKTTVSQKIYELLSKHHKNIILLDGDHARKIFVNESGYDPISRSKNIKKYVGSCELA